MPPDPGSWRSKAEAVREGGLLLFIFYLAWMLSAAQQARDAAVLALLEQLIEKLGTG